MWIVIRLVLAVVGFVARQLARNRKPGEWRDFEGGRYFAVVVRAKGAIKRFTIGMERSTPTWIRCHAESAADRAFKAMGVANEIQTGDRKFDDKVYVTCDHPHVHTVLAESQELRDALYELVDSGYTVFFDGTYVRAERASDIEPTNYDVAKLKALWTASWKLSDAPPSRFGDPFLWKALVVEGVIWSIAGYAIGAAIGMFVSRADEHVRRGDLWQTGLIAAVIAFGVLLLVIGLWMRGSSRGHRVIVETAIVLVLCLPVATVQVVGDTNRALDDSPPTIHEVTLSECQVREHRGRRGRRSYSYHLRIVDPPPPMPYTVETSKTLCDAAYGETTATIAISRGRWGIPWYRYIEIAGVRWDGL